MLYTIQLNKPKITIFRLNVKQFIVPAIFNLYNRKNHSISWMWGDSVYQCVFMLLAQLESKSYQYRHSRINIARARGREYKSRVRHGSNKVGNRLSQ